MHDLLSTASGQIVCSNTDTLVIFDKTVEGDISTSSEPIKVQEQGSLPGLIGTESSTGNNFYLLSSGPIMPSTSGMQPSTASGLTEAPRSPSLPNQTVLFGSSMIRNNNELHLSNSNCKTVYFSRSEARLVPGNGSPVYWEMVKEFLSSSNSDLHLFDHVFFN